MIRGIIFDCFGVLYEGSLQTLLGLCPAEKVQNLRDLSLRSDYGFISRDEYLGEFASLIGRTVEEVEDIMRQRHIRNKELLQYALNLRSDYKVAMLSNVSDKTIEELFTPDELEEYFDEVVLSYKEHLVKPNPAMFELMAERLGLPASDCIMIDDLETNCEGARAVGMQAVQHVSNKLTVEKITHILYNNC